jgi:glycosyltransferase involved in cell wall biosynthesis
MRRVIEVFRPDVAHVHAPSRYLTPSVLRPLERAGVPVVMTLHDMKPWCTNRILFAHDAPCERCRGGRHYQSLLTGCVQNSRARSAVAMVEAYLHEWLHAYRAVRLWIAPSEFVRAKAVSLGLDPAVVRVLPHGLEPVTASVDASGAPPPEAYVLHAGRLSVEKGVKLLPGIAARIAPTPLLVVGDGPLRAELDAAAARQPNLRLMGRVSDADLSRLRREAAVVIVPSIFYEHFCYAAAEALLDARPVVAARIGAIPELVEHEITGLLAPAGDPIALADAVKRALEDPHSARRAEAGRERVLELADPARHLEGLLGIYAEAMGVRETVAAH